MLFPLPVLVRQFSFRTYVVGTSCTEYEVDRSLAVSERLKSKTSQIRISWDRIYVQYTIRTVNTSGLTVAARPVGRKHADVQQFKDVGIHSRTEYNLIKKN